MKFRYPPRRTAGFSLVELSVVLVIMGAMLGMVLSGLGSFSQNAAYTTARSKQVAVQESLLSYLRANGRLPCPDSGQPNSAPISTVNLPDGIENRLTEGDPTTGCRSASGIVPYVTLGVPRDAALDTWGNFFTYVVSNNLAPAAPLTPTPTRDWVISNNFRTGSLGDIEVLDDAGASTNAAAVLISHGVSGSGAYTTKGSQITGPNGAHEIANATGCPRAATQLLRCYKREFTENSAAAGGSFDDIVLIMTPNMLLDPLFAQSVRHPPASEFQRACTEIKDRLAAIGLANRSGTTPNITYNVSPAAAAAYPISNPYGGILPCNIAANVQIGSAVGFGNLCPPMESLGQNGIPGGNDDLTCTISADDLRVVFSRAGF